MRHKFGFDGRIHKHVKDVPQHSDNDCNCINCQKSRVHGAQLMKRADIYNRGVQSPVNYRDDHADGPPNPKTAADYIGATLKAAKQLDILKGGKKVRTVQAGQTIGVVDSWLTNPNRFLLTSGESVAITPGAFDEKTAVESLKLNQQTTDAKILAKVEERKAANDSTLYKAGAAVNEAVAEFPSMLAGFGTYLKWGLILLVLAVIAGVFLRAKG